MILFRYRTLEKNFVNNDFTVYSDTIRSVIDFIGINSLS